MGLAVDPKYTKKFGEIFLTLQPPNLFTFVDKTAANVSVASHFLYKNTRKNENKIGLIEILIIYFNG